MSEGIQAPRLAVSRGQTRDVVLAHGFSWRRTLLRTRWLTERDDLGAVLADALGRAPTGGSDRLVLAVAEKAAVVTSGRTVATDRLRPSSLAKSLARAVKPVGDSCGLSVPAKMQYVIDTAGALRVLSAAAAAALTRPLGILGVFYRIAGPVARDLDGARGAYPDLLLPPLSEGEAQLLAHHLATRLRVPVAIVDINDRGGTVRGRSPGCPPATVLLDVLADNPLGHCRQSTPAILLRY